MPHMTIAQGIRALDEHKSLFETLFSHGSLDVEIYRPDSTDLQEPHERDEIYVVASGSGMFSNGENRHAFTAGDVMFVPAGQIHRFEDFSDDFVTWVFFYGPQGGELPNGD